MLASGGILDLPQPFFFVSYLMNFLQIVKKNFEN
jgi:hypothetical protein